jgi:hypothetical protein
VATQSALSGQIVLRPLDQVMTKFGDQLRQLGAEKARKVMARALNYEGRKTFTQVKRSIYSQTSIPYAIINRETKFKGTSTTRAATLSTAIDAKGKYPTLKLFKPKQIKVGVSALVWSKRQKYRGAFGAPGDRPKLVSKLKGIPFHRVGKSRYPIKPLFGPNVAVEMVRNDPPRLFLASTDRIVDRVAIEIAAILRGY